MAYRMPSDTEVIEAIKDAFQRYGVVNTQKKLTELVLVELHRHDTEYTVGEARIRKLVIENGLAGMEIRCRETARRSSAGACPVCAGRTERIKNLTVYGGTVTSGYRCRTCGYWTGLQRRVPVLYIFTPKSAT